MKVTDKFVLFWGGILSNFAKCDPPIIYGNTLTRAFHNPNQPYPHSFTLPTSEHLFMYLKAIYFKDYDIANKILEAKEPSEAKALGRQVSGFSEEEWEKVRYRVMFSAVYYKAYYNTAFKDLLLKDEWKDLEFVEASPYDRIWGIGLAEGDPDASVKKKWRGLNLLGKALCEVRSYIKWIQWVTTWGLNEFHEDLIWCPSQIYYWFMVGQEMKLVYMRWRWSDPWSIELCNVKDPSKPHDWSFDDSEKLDLGKEYKDSEYQEMEKDLLLYLMKRFPEVKFPFQIIRKDPHSWGGTKII
jgi:ribA/ribD-fused uncharacterized protein